MEHDYIYKTLTKFNFGENFIRWAKPLYSGSSAKVKIDGYLSESFSISRGIKQGSSISALLFNLAVETMALSIKKNDKIQGIKMIVSNTTYHIKVTQYADDCTLFLAGLNNIPEALAQINKFTRVSGLQQNIEKTEGMYVGIQRPVNDKIYNIKFVIEPLKFLGICVGENETDCNEENWNEKILKIEKILASWKRRDLTIFEKILIIKTLTLSIITHVAISLTVSPKIIKRLNKLFYGFIWGKRDQMKKYILRLPLDIGGATWLMLNLFLHLQKLHGCQKYLTAKVPGVVWGRNIYQNLVLKYKYPIFVLIKNTVSRN